MAKFAVHLYGAAAVSSAGALGAYSLGWAGSWETQMLFFLGVAGGLLPDIDADNSTPVRGFFTLLGVALAFLVSFTLVGRLPVLELALVWCGLFLAVRYGMFEVFARLTVHRGVWHSWLAAAFAALATVAGLYHGAGLSPRQSWLGGLFVGIGYLTHLCLDELASVDLLGRRVKSSFGTALKPFSFSSPWASLTMLVVAIALAYVAPPLQPVLEAGSGHRLSFDTLRAGILGDKDWLARVRAALR